MEGRPPATVQMFPAVMAAPQNVPEVAAAARILLPSEITWLPAASWVTERGPLSWARVAGPGRGWHPRGVGRG